MGAITFLKDLRHRVFYRLILRPKSGLIRLGDQWTWTIDPVGLGPKSVVYCAGAGDDISFELELARKFNCKVLVLDPSPTGILTMSKPENTDPLIDFEPIGLSDRDSRFEFDIPADRTGASYTLSDGNGKSGGTDSNRTLFACESLPTIMKRHGHKHIDLLKMDIEGFEYGVLRQIIEQRISINQICVEFHHFLLPQFSNKDTISAILGLRRLGLQLVYKSNWDHTFVKF